MTIIVELPRIAELQCDSSGNISKKDLDAYFKNIGRTMGRLSLSTTSINSQCSSDVVLAVAAIEEIMKLVEGITTNPFQNLKCKELEFRYRARELSKDIEEYFKRSIVEILLDVAQLLGLPNPFIVPIPFIGSGTLKIADLFTKDGQKKVKLAIKDDIKSVEEFLGIESTYNGDLGIKAPDLQTEEAWHKIKNWFNQLINDFIGAVAEGIANVVKNIPIIGKPIYDLVMSSVDPTIAIEKSFDNLVTNYKAKIKQAKEDLLSGKIAEDIGQELLDEVINIILDINIPLIGTIGDLIDIDPKNRDIIIKEDIFHELEDAVKEFIQKARRFFKGGIIVSIHKIMDAAPGYILQQFPIVGKILKIIKKVADILSGKNPLTECDVLSIILPEIFDFASLIENLLPSCIEVRYVE